MLFQRKLAEFYWFLVQQEHQGQEYERQQCFKVHYLGNPKSPQMGKRRVDPPIQVLLRSKQGSGCITCSA